MVELRHTTPDCLRYTTVHKKRNGSTAAEFGERLFAALLPLLDLLAIADLVLDRECLVPDLLQLLLGFGLLLEQRSHELESVTT